ncbi:MAG: Cupredoxin [Linnemannia elongata]|nr:MAG: Cupredoxin [Linnemannia elongata]
MHFYAITILSAILVPVFAAVHTVTIKNFSFQPQTVNINPGDQVTWTNGDTVPHTATANAGLFDSGPIAPGGTFSRTFSIAATVPYHCSIHPIMLGKVAASVNTTSSATATITTATGTAKTTAATTATTTATITTVPSSGNTLNTPFKAILSIGGGVAVLAQLL